MQKSMFSFKGNLNLNSEGLVVTCTVAFLMGVLLVQRLSELVIEHFIFSLVCILVFLLLALLVRTKRRVYCCVFLIALAFGFARSYLYAHAQLNTSLPALDYRIKAELSGCIDSIPKLNEKMSRFTFHLQNEKQLEYPLKRIQVSIYKQTGIDLKRFTAGSCWRLPLRIKTNRGLRNTDTFDYEKWLLQKNISATAYMRGSAKELNRPHFSLLMMRNYLAERINQTLHEHPSRALVLGLTLGIRDEIGTGAWEVLQKTGTSHLLAISGLHIGIAALFGFYFGKLLWLLLSLVKRPRMTATHFGLGFSLLIALLYSALAGFSVPTQRASIMLACGYLGILSQHRWNSITLLSLALFVILFIDPIAALSVGTWLSFLAVLTLMLILGRDKHRRLKSNDLNKWLNRARATIRMQMLLVVFVSLPVIYTFKQFSFIAPLVNIVFIPIFTFTIVPALLLIMLMLLPFPIVANTLLILSADGLSLLWKVLEYLAKMRFSAANYPSHILLLIITGLLLTVLLFPKKLYPKKFIALTSLPFLFSLQQAGSVTRLELNVFDVGQGLAVLIKTQNKVLLYDTGPAYKSGSSVMQRVIVPKLHKAGIHTIDMLVLSHSDNDHAGGAMQADKQFSIDQMYAPENDPVLNSLPCEAGKRWQWDDVKFEFIYPYKDVMHSNNNNVSCVLRVSMHTPNGEKVILLTGDIEKEAEQLLLASEADLGASIVIAPHHGSNSSSTSRFAKRVNPDIVVYSTGFANQWGFPKATVIQSWDRANSNVKHFSTAKDGELNFNLSAKGQWEIQTWRNNFCKYWHKDCN